MLAKTAVFDKSPRSGVPTSLIVIATGTSSDDVTEPSQKLRDRGVAISVVGVGKDTDANQLNDMASDPDAQHLYLADYDSLSTLVSTIKDKVCEGKD